MPDKVKVTDLDPITDLQNYNSQFLVDISTPEGTYIGPFKASLEEVLKNASGNIANSDDVDEGLTNLYFTNSRVTNNSTVASHSATIAALGTASTKNVGQGPLNVIQLTNDSKIPALDGSLLFNITGNFNTSVREILSTTKTLNSSSPAYQYLNPNGAHRIVILPNPPVQDSYFKIKHIGTGHSLKVRTSLNGIDLAIITTTTRILEAHYDGTEWQLELR